MRTARRAAPPMPRPDPEFSTPRTATRAPVGRPVKLHFDDSTAVEQGVCQDISIGGMFVAMEATRPQGTLVRFEIGLDDAASVRGLGEVIWRRETGTGSARDAGMGIKFRFLEQQDRQLILRIVSQHIKERLARRQSASAYQPVLAPEAPAAPSPSPVAAEEPEDLLADVDEELAAPAAPAAVAVSEEAADVAAVEETDDVADVADVADVDDVAPPPVAAVEPSRDDDSGSVYRTPPAPSLGGWSADAGLDAGDEEPPQRTSPPSPRPLASAPINPYSPPSRPRPVPRRRGGGAGWIVVLLLLAGAAMAWVFWDDFFAPEPGPVTLPEPAPPAPLSEAAPPAPAAAPEEAAALPAIEDPLEVPAVEEASPPPPAAASATLTRVVDITWSQLADGLRVEVTGDGVIARDAVSRFRLEEPSPREVVRIAGVTGRYPRETIAVGGPGVTRIRTGLHERRGTSELHLVLDLAAPTYRVTDLRAAGRTLEIDVAAP